MSIESIILTLIVKDEEHVIERCLRSALPYVDKYLIVDTGSTDKTQEKIRQTAEQLGVSGFIFERPWVNFGHNRSEVLQLVRETFTSDSSNDSKHVWAFMIDADDFLCGSSDCSQLRSHLAALRNQQPQKNAATLSIHKGSIHYKRTCIFHSSVRWGYEGSIHEYPKCEDEAHIGSLADKGYYIEARCEGARSKDPLKYEKDAEMLSAELAVNPLNTRAAFYYAQSLRDAGQAVKAVEAYKRRATLGGWNEEVYISVLNIVRMWGDLSLLWKAAGIRRLEVAAEAMRICRLRSDFNQEVYAFAAQVKDVLKEPKDGLFIEPEYYKWIFWDEFAIFAYYTANYKESYMASLRAEHGCPPDHKDRIRKNVEFALDKL
jgi:glycosyltransferase involved in cell wall biosynthesis